VLVEAVEATLEKDVELVEGATAFKVIHHSVLVTFYLCLSVSLSPADICTTHSTDCSRLKVVERPVSICY
jgi:hypothetical protein